MSKTQVIKKSFSCCFWHPEQTMSVDHNLVSQLNVGESSHPSIPSVPEDVDILMFDEKETDTKGSWCEGYPHPADLRKMILIWFFFLQPPFCLPEKVHSCDQERQSALEEARQNPREGIVIPECAPGGLYKPVQCHQSTGYCWCVLVDTGRPLPGTSTRWEL